MRLFSVLAASLLAFPACSNSGVPGDTAQAPSPHESMRIHAEQLLADTMISSVSIGLYKGGEKYSGHFGELDPGMGNRPEDNTIYEIASVSKTFTGLLVAQAVLDGKLSIDDDVNKYLNDDYPNFYYNEEPIRIRHLLTHTSGLPGFLPESINPLLEDFNEDVPFEIRRILAEYSKEEILKDLKSFRQPSEPGTTYAYSNVGTELIAHILEQVYSKPFSQLLFEQITSKANMPDTRIALNSEQSSRLASGYGMTNEPAPDLPNSLWGADGAIKSTTSDLLQYMALQLDSSSLAVLKSHEVVYDGDNEVRGYYWPIENKQEYGTYLRHHGGAFGTQNWFVILPDCDMGLSVITNQSGPKTAGKLMKTVSGLLESQCKVTN